MKKDDPQIGQIGQMKRRRPHAKNAKYAKRAKKDSLCVFFAPLAILA
jgi:hypothetical protein